VILEGSTLSKTTSDRLRSETVPLEFPFDCKKKKERNILVS
jgi:hypothetical protein